MLAAAMVVEPQTFPLAHPTLAEGAAANPGIDVSLARPTLAAWRMSMSCIRTESLARSTHAGAEPHGLNERPPCGVQGPSVSHQYFTQNGTRLVRVRLKPVETLVRFLLREPFGLFRLQSAALVAATVDGRLAHLQRLTRLTNGLLTANTTAKYPYRL